MKRVGWDPRKLAKSDFLLAQNEDISNTYDHAEFRHVHFFLCCAYHDSTIFWVVTLLLQVGNRRGTYLQ